MVCGVRGGSGKGVRGVEVRGRRGSGAEKGALSSEVCAECATKNAAEKMHPPSSSTSEGTAGGTQSASSMKLTD